MYKSVIEMTRSLNNDVCWEFDFLCDNVKQFFERVYDFVFPK